MKFKIKKPITSFKKQIIKFSGKNLKNKPLLKNKIIGLKTNSGRNNTGKITIRHKGGGHKQKYRKINFYFTNSLIAIVCSIEYDPNRNSNIASIYDINEKFFLYILAPKGLKIGDIVKSGSNAEPKLGHSLPVKEIPIGSCIYNVSPKKKNNAQIARAAGTFARLVDKTLENVKVKLPSGEIRLLSPECHAIIGIVSNDLVFLSKLGKAGRSRWLSIRPGVRGVAMNPIDHPHGGGEGKKSGKGKNPWGKPVKGGKTSNSRNKLIFKKYSNG